MAKYRITGPDGAAYDVTAPDGASEADVMAYAQKNYAPKPKEQDFSFDPMRDMNMGERALAGVGKAFTDIGRGAGQLVGAVSREDVADARKLDAPLMNTTAGAVGNFAGNVAAMVPAAGIPGANTVAGAGVIGAGMGLLAPSTSTSETLTNVALGGAGGAAGQAIANKVPALLKGRVDAAKAAQAGNAQKFATAQAGAKEGLIVPPADLEPGAVSEVVSGLSGKIKTAQVASQRNQGVADRLGRQAIGLKPGDVLDADALQTIRQQAAARGYDPVKQAGMVQSDAAYVTALDNIASTQQGAAKSFPGLGENGVADLVAKLKQPAFDASDAVDATKVLRAAADKAYRQGDPTLGKANKAAADAIEGMLERHLQAIGQPDALKAFRDARQLIAKTYSVQKAANGQTGNVSIPALAKQLEKGKPLSGELLQLAQFGQAFPKATQALKEAPKTWSPLDMAFAGGTAIGTGNPMAALLLGARPLARSALLSGPVQRRALQQGAAAPFTQATQTALENRLSQLLLAPVGNATGLALAM